jgi:hypothetical protein
VASGSCHRFVIGVLASATLVAAPVASSKARDCRGAVEDAAAAAK